MTKRGHEAEGEKGLATSFHSDTFPWGGLPCLFLGEARGFLLSCGQPCRVPSSLLLAVQPRAQ